MARNRLLVIAITLSIAFGSWAYDQSGVAAENSATSRYLSLELDSISGPNTGDVFDGEVRSIYA